MKKDTTATSVAIIQLAGKQFVVQAGDRIETEKLEVKNGDTLAVTEVLLINDGQQTTIGTPFVQGASVSLVLDKTVKGEKVEVMKYKSKSRYRRSTGHRQTLSYLTVTGITLK